MSLDHAILGFLNYEPMSGYDLKSVFDMSVKHFWPADQSQIYRTLSKLAEQGYAEIERVQQEDKPDRKVYHITESGKTELHRWLTTGISLCGDRCAQLIQIFFAGGLTDEEILIMLRGMAEETRKGLGMLQAIKEHAREPENAKPRDSFFWWLTLDKGIHMTHASLEWFEKVIAQIENKEHIKGETR